MTHDRTNLPPAGLFVTGSDTGVGKTFVTTAICQALRQSGCRVAVYKPVATGCRFERDRLISDDALELWEAAGRPGELNAVCPQRFGAAAAPPVAAAQEGKSVDADLLRSGAHCWHSQCDFLLVEGVGGLLCPLTETETVADLAGDLGYPLVVLARLGLGTLNHTLLTLEVARHRRLKVAGVILNSPEPGTGSLAERTNPDELRRRLRCPVLAVVPYVAGPGDGETHTQSSHFSAAAYSSRAHNSLLAASLLSNVDWMRLAQG